MELKLIDLSYHNGAIDFVKVKTQVDGIILRCGYGSNITSKMIRSLKSMQITVLNAIFHLAFICILMLRQWKKLNQKRNIVCDWQNRIKTIYFIQYT